MKIRRNLLLSLFVVSALTSCSFFKKVSTAPNTTLNKTIYDSLTYAAIYGDALYDTIIEAPNKTYTSFEGKYEILKQKADNILALEKVYADPTLIQMAQKFDEKVHQYADDHKRFGQLSLGQANTYKDYYYAFISPLLQAHKPK